MRSTLALVIFSIALAILSTVVYAENHTQTDPCAGVTCSSPPAAECDVNNVKTYSSSGTCSAGQCSYSSSTSACRFGCSLGQCKPCESSACGTNSKTCADGFTSTCQQSCSGEQCAACEPSCAGHETAPATQNTSTGSGSGSSTSSNGTTTSNLCANVICNTPPATSCNGNNIRFFSSPGACNNGICSYSETGYACQNGCSNGACIMTNGTETRPAPDLGPLIDCGGFAVHSVDGKCPAPACGNNICEPGEADTGGCPPGSPPECLGPPVQTGTCPSDCRRTSATDYACPNYSPPNCGPNERIDSHIDANGCPVPRCRPAAQCPTGCDCRFGERVELVSSFCQNEKRCNYNNVCDKDEETRCRGCIGADCPINRQCPDGSGVKCERTERGCNCEPCQLQDVPQGCRQVTENGLIRVVCDKPRECPPVPQDVRLKCADGGGIPRFNKDHSGCNVFQCDFGGERTNGSVFATPVNCPSPEGILHALEKCKELGLPGVIGFEGGCKVGKCQQEQHEQRCHEVSRRQVEQECWSKDMDVAPYYQDGCPAYRCVERRGRQCEQDLPKEAYERCSREGGQLVVRKNQDGCVSYSSCLRRGNSEESFVEDIDEIPDTTELLSIAFKLEDLKLEFDKLAKKTNDIAEYYKSTGSSDEKRFRRVSDMFSSAKEKVDEVKTKLKEMANDIGKDDVLEIKQDLRYLKDVVLKDILFVMLGSGDEIEEIKSGATKSCGTDESCFDRAFRVCQPLTFRPEGKEGPVIEVTGIEGDACVMEVRME